MSGVSAWPVGPVALRVADVGRVAAFYEEIIGLERRPADGEHVELGTPEETLIRAVPDPGAPPPAPDASGLYHVAIRVPSRADLGRAIARLAATRQPLIGSADHLVSEAVYLSDPEGNGIELYRDRPRERWPYRDGMLQMANAPLDAEGLVGAGGVDGRRREPVASGTRIGHVHLRVGDVAAVEAFYRDRLGMESTAHLAGAAFMSLQGYHHHIAANSWHGRGGPPATSGSLGLDSLELRLAPEGVESAIARVDAAGDPLEVRDGRVHTSDPAGTLLVLRSTAAP
jgi:catechol 2,3-dioxygenase